MVDEAKSVKAINNAVKPYHTETNYGPCISRNKSVRPVN